MEEQITNTVTVYCPECGWITDLDILSMTNPTVCPKCYHDLHRADNLEPYEG